MVFITTQIKIIKLGVADLHTLEAVAAAKSATSSCQPVLAVDGSEIYSEGRSADYDSEDDEIEESISGKDNIHENKREM
ncbi:hypothetical protein CR513_43927, partial [Mucuna pruriens]